MKITTNNVQVNNEASLKKSPHIGKLWECEECLKTFATKSSLTRHQTGGYCKENKLVKLMEKLVEDNREKDKIIKQMANENNKIIINGSKQILKNNEKVTDMAIKTQDNVKFILQHFADAPNFAFPENAREIIAGNMEKYINCGRPMKAIRSAILTLIKHKKQEERSIHGIDKSRNKYMIKIDDKWKIEYHAKKVIDQFMELFTVEAQNYVVDNMKTMPDSQADKSCKMIEFIEKPSTANKLAKEIYPSVSLDQLAYLESITQSISVKKGKR